MSEGRRRETRDSTAGQMRAEERDGAHDVVDMELACVTCHAHLYVSVAQIGAVMTSLERTGAAILICICGQAQLIRARHLPRHD